MENICLGLTITANFLEKSSKKLRRYLSQRPSFWMVSGTRSVTMQYCDTIYGKVISLMILINLIHSVLLSYHTIKYLCLFYFSQLPSYTYF